jgi:hypothetical protein
MASNEAGCALMLNQLKRTSASILMVAPFGLRLQNAGMRSLKTEPRGPY